MQVVDLRGKKHSFLVKPIDWDKLSRSKFQKTCKDMLRLHWEGDIVGEEVTLPGTRLKFDFVNMSRKIIIEIQGGQHMKYNKFFHKNNIYNMVGSLKRDEQKERFAALNGFKFLAITSTVHLAQALAEL